MKEQEIITVLERMSDVQQQIIQQLKLKFTPAIKVNKRIYVSNREYDVLGLMAKGLNNKEIAKKLCISERTVKTHISNIYSRIKENEPSTRRVKAVLMFLRGIIDSK